MHSLQRYFHFMKAASITIRNLDARLKQKLRVRAARHGQSMEAEARDILRIALATESGSGKHLVDSVRSRFARAGFLDLELPSRKPVEPAPDLS